MKVWISSLLISSLALFARTGPPDFLSIYTGRYDYSRDKHQTFEFGLEYKLHFRCLQPPNSFVQFAPLFGAMATAKGSFYGYIGINFDLLFLDHIHISPGFATGYYQRGKGKKLGYPIEFRTGVELAWQFSDWHRVGMHFYHLSNASMGNRNPGEESLILFYDIPIIKWLPFDRDNK